MEPHTVVAAAGAVRRASQVLLVGAVLAVFAVTLLGSTSPSGRVNLIPGASVVAVFQEADERNALQNVLGNVALFVPLGFFGLLAFRRGLLAVTALAAVLSVAIEATQLVLGDRWVDVDDVLLNSFGAYVGAVAAVVVMGFAGRSRAPRRPTDSGDG